MYTHKTYEKAADICNCYEVWIKRINIVLLALTSGSALGSILELDYFLVATSILSTLALIFVSIQYNFNYGSQAQEYKRTALKLWLIREKYQIFIADIMSDRLSTAEIVEKRDLLVDELYKIQKNAPNTFSRAYKKASKALKVKEDMTFTTKEIDLFLPDELRLR